MNRPDAIAVRLVAQPELEDLEFRDLRHTRAARLAGWASIATAFA